MNKLRAAFFTDDAQLLALLQKEFEPTPELEAAFYSPRLAETPRADAVFLSATAAQSFCPCPSAFSADICSTSSDPVVAKYAPLAIVGGVLAPGDDPFDARASYQTFAAALRAVSEHNAVSDTKIETILLPAFWFVQSSGATDQQCRAVHQAYKDWLSDAK